MTAVIKVSRLPSAPYPPTPKYERQTIEVPKDAKVVIVGKPMPASSTELSWDEHKKRYTRVVFKKRGPDKRVLTADEIERVIALYKEGVWTKEIAKRICCNQPLIRETVQKLVADGVLVNRTSPRELTEKEITRVRTLYMAGISGRRIAKELHCGERLVYEEIAVVKEENRL